MGLLLLILAGLLLWYVSSSTRKNAEKATAQRINQQWVDYLAGYINLSTKPAEKASLLAMLADLEAQGMPQPSLPFVTERQADTAVTASRNNGVSAQATATSPYTQAMVQPLSEQDAWQTGFSSTTYAQPSARKTELDNTTILLYFGAFLFVAAAGLFVAFGGANGGLRTLTVLVVALAFYFGGLWLHDHRSKLKQAALTFVGIGIALAPLVGVAAYAYVFKSSGGVVWLATSAFCLGLYAIALQRLRHPLLEYIMIGTFVSLFESAVAITHGPIYYYAWMLAACGLLLKAWSLARKWSPGLQTSSGISAHVLLPVALFASLYMVPEHGILQLGIALLLGAVFYALQAWESVQDRAAAAAVAHSLLLASGASFAYGYSHDVLHVAWALLGFTILQTVMTLFLSGSQPLARNAASVGLVSAGTAALFGSPKPVVSLIAVGILAISSGVTWLKQHRVDAYEVASIALVILPFIYAYAVQNTAALNQELFAASALGGVSLLQLALFYALRKSRFGTEMWRLAFRFTMIIGLFVGFVVTCFMGGWWPLAAGTFGTVLSLIMRRHDPSDKDWLASIAVFTIAPLFVTWHAPSVFLAAAGLAVLWQLYVVLLYRFEAARWLGTLAWLVLPAALAHRWTGIDNATWYASAYVAAAAGLILARTVARRRIRRLPATVAELERRLKTDSLSYVFGYTLAAVIALGASLAAGRFAPPVVACAFTLLLWFVSTKVEKQPELLGILPLLAQFALWGTYRQDSELEAYALASTVIATASFVVGARMQIAAGRAVQLTALAALYVTPLLALAGASTWALPAGLAVAGLATLYAVWRRPQEERELAGTIVLVSLLWFLYYHGIRNTQAYTHLIATLLGGYAYWRAKRGDSEGRHNYIVAMLSVATVPLALQAMSGQAGGLYGVWLIAEQVAIMLLGMALRDGFVVRWGLYVAIGAVLYQLRGLGWAMVAVLAIFLIGLALYRLQRSDTHNPDTSSAGPKDRTQ